jgi:DEAD/DEAH box helicase domain-containing protein
LPPTELQTTGYWIAISEETVNKLAKDGLWTNAPNDYGPEWPILRERIRARDGFRCQVCGLVESGIRQPGDDVSPERNLAGPIPARQHDVHHKIPFRQFHDESGRILRERANRPDNLVTLCPECHKKAEQNVRMRSGLAGLATVLEQLAPLYLMCDTGDLGVHYDPQAAFADGLPAVVLFDQVPAGIGFSQRLFEIHGELLTRSLELVNECPCEDGCPSCVGPAGENGVGGKQEALAILKELVR